MKTALDIAVSKLYAENRTVLNRESNETFLKFDYFLLIGFKIFFMICCTVTV